MNKRQKKKRYKKLYGHNPIKGADGRIEEMKAYNLKPEDIERIADILREAFACAAQVMSDFAAAVSRVFADMAKQYRKPVIEQVEEAPAVVARNLTERRKKCRQNKWKVSSK